MKGLNGGIPLAVLAATAHAQGIYKGPHGDDTGNAASVGHKNEAEFETTQDIKDDHSWKGPGPWPGHPHAWGPWKRGDINEGPTGDDTGNAAAVGNENEAESETTQHIKDDHSWKGPGPWYPHPYYPPPPGHWKRGDINEGPTGDDTGNAANIGHKNEAESETTQHIKDDHSWKGPGPWYPHPYYPPPPGHWKRGDINEGPTGDDTGNAANIGHKNEAEFETNQDIKDDHSWKGYPGWPYWYPGAPYPYPGPRNHGENRPARGYHTGLKEARGVAGDINEGPNGDDTGNVANIINTNSASNDYDGSYEDNHGVEIDYSWPWHQKRAFAPSTGSGDDDEGSQHSPAITNNEMTYPGQDTHGANGEACQASQVTRTVTMTRTHTAMATETAAVEDPEEDPEDDPEYPEYLHAAQTPASSQAAQSEYPSQAVQNPNLHSGMATNAAPIATPVVHSSQASAPEPTQAYHGPAASQITVGEASAYTVIPVYVPSGAAHGSVVIQASSTPASSSAFRTHALPTGASPEQNAASSSSATPSSSHGPISFTGAAAGKLVPSAGVFTALAGAAALLAFAL
ncbi:putative GPI anchored protein [Aspergillus puulaauensis]|uniref:GPI anchored protein n=1 Tax=Aspergillus puulaauensis TaxID=1220207 RepID=A0A7R8AJ60_9EURO|nr:uncharacterized protein APUU_21248A [Aspergillus puulaauensis]BCS20816.1 hypothetical protein APUU_21248A [Aspergillus puulaauensis]